MSRIGDLVKSARNSMKMTQESLAAETGYSVAGIRKIESGAVKTVQNPNRLMGALGIAPSDWLEAVDEDRRDELRLPRLYPEPVPRVRRVLASGMIPIVGRAAASGDPGRLIMINEVTDYAPCPPELEGVSGAFAVYVYGESMMPRFFPNERVYVYPNRPLARNDFCVVQIGAPEPECAYIKRFISMDEKELRLEQYNPQKSLFSNAPTFSQSGALS